MSYRIEVSPNKRAGCQNVECKKEGIKIQKGELRFGTFVQIMENQSWRYKHWGCVTPVQIEHLKATTDGNAKELDGYDELPEDFQEKVKNALLDGHVADDDWMGDVEMNRPGMKGFRTPASKKAKREEAKAAKDAEEDGSTSPSKAQPNNEAIKKRARANGESEGEAVVNEPAPKRSKATRNAATKVKKEDTHSESEGDNEPVKNARGKSKKFDDDDFNGASDSNPKPAKTTRGRGKKTIEKEVNSESIEKAQPVGKARGETKAIPEEDGNNEIATGPASGAQADANNDGLPYVKPELPYTVKPWNGSPKVKPLSPIPSVTSISSRGSSDYDVLKKALGLKSSRHIQKVEPLSSEGSDSGGEKPSENTGEDVKAAAESKKNRKTGNDAETTVEPQAKRSRKRPLKEIKDDGGDRSENLNEEEPQPKKARNLRQKKMARGPGDNAKTTSEEEPQPKGGRKGTHKKITASVGKRAEQPEQPTRSSGRGTRKYYNYNEDD